MSQVISTDADIFASYAEEIASSTTCEFQDCTQTAVAFLVCGEPLHEANSPSAESICREHLEWVRWAIQTDPEEVIIFNKTCSHTAFLVDCKVVPI